MMNEIKRKIFPANKYLGIYVDEDIRTFKNPDAILQKLQKVLAFANENNIRTPKHHVAIYETKPNSINLRLFIGYPIDEKVVIINSQFTTLEIPKSDSIITTHKGAHSSLPEIHKQMHNKITEISLYINEYIIEEYEKYSTTEPDPDKWITKICYLTRKTNPSGGGSKTRKKKTILILEDEEMLSDALSVFLTEYGFEVVVAKTGNEAEEIISNKSFDFALLDLLVPGESGFEIFKLLRDKQTNIPIFILSNLEEVENKKKALGLGANKYFVKSDTLLSDVAKEISDFFAK